MVRRTVTALLLIVTILPAVYFGGVLYFSLYVYICGDRRRGICAYFSNHEVRAEPSINGGRYPAYPIHTYFHACMVGVDLRRTDPACHDGSIYLLMSVAVTRPRLILWLGRNWMHVSTGLSRRRMRSRSYMIGRPDYGQHKIKRGLVTATLISKYMDRHGKQDQSGEGQLRPCRHESTYE